MEVENLWSLARTNFRGFHTNFRSSQQSDPSRRLLVGVWGLGMEEKFGIASNMITLACLLARFTRLESWLSENGCIQSFRRDVQPYCRPLLEFNDTDYGKSISDTEKQFNLGASSKFASFFQNPANNFPSFALKILVLPASYARNWSRPERYTDVASNDPHCRLRTMNMVWLLGKALEFLPEYQSRRSCRARQ